jgi:hypothetical protein
MDCRALSPAYPFWILLLITVAVLTRRLYGGASVRYRAWLGLLVLAVGINAARSMREIHDYRTAGQGMEGPYWRKSKLIDYVRSLPAQTDLYSDAGPACYFLANRPTRQLPYKYDAITLTQNPDYSRQLARFKDAAESETGVVVLSGWCPACPSRGELLGLGFHVIFSSPDGLLLEPRKRGRR